MTHRAEALGATYLGDGSTRFVVWAPNATDLQLHLLTPKDCLIPLEACDHGYFTAHVHDVGPGSRYFYRFPDGKERPDPASRYQPEGVHGPSGVVDRFFDWRDSDWFGLPLPDYVIYELHVGTFSEEGTFDGAIPHLARLAELGVTALELMPIAQFPGDRNWGYDSVLPFAVQNSYGGPEGLKRFVDACHRTGLAVILDVVYNHFGPEGNYIPEYGPYFTDRYKTPWGLAANFDGAGSNEVRRFFLENAEMWAREYHLDALRLDAVDNLFDTSAFTFIEELASMFDELEQHLPRELYLTGEADYNNPRLCTPREAGGIGLDAQWTDDFHHALFTLLTGDITSYYVDFKPDAGAPLELLAKALRDGYVYTGQYSVFREYRRGVSARSLPGYRHIVFSQNHDQVGNRMLGDRFSALVSWQASQLAAGLVLLSPFIPLLFMGEEYAEERPFLYFADYRDEELVEAVKKGRRGYFGSQWQGEPPDFSLKETFNESKLSHADRQEGKHQRMWEFYHELIGLRKTLPALKHLSKEHQGVDILAPFVLLLRRWHDASQAAVLFNLAPDRAGVELSLPAGRWQVLLNSTDPRFAESDVARSGATPASIEMPLRDKIEIPARSFILMSREAS